jgi:hypothetical protein
MSGCGDIQLLKLVNLSFPRNTDTTPDTFAKDGETVKIRGVWQDRLGQAN